MSVNELIRFGISWGPTIIFLLVVLSHFLIGLHRGQRKSLILAIQSFILFMLCFTLFVVLINVEKIDVLTFEFINKILEKFNTSIGALLGVSGNSLKDIIIKMLPDIVGYGNVLNSLFTDNAAYLNTLVSLIYNLFFAVLCYILFLIVNFVAYLCYLFFYNNKKYARKCNRLYRNNAQSYAVSKNRFGGGMIGLLKGFVSGIVLMSFIGSLFFIVGGDGKSESKDISFGDSTIDTVYTAYDALGSYANSGILKILTDIKNDEEVPYYLFAFDLVFSGKYKDDLNNINTNFIVRDEVGEYIKLTRKTFDLLLEHDVDGELRNCIAGNSQKNMNQILLNIFQNTGFSNDFRTVIDDFEAKTYLINLTLGFINSMLVNIDQNNMGLPAQTTELVKILFKGENSIKVNDLVRPTDIKLILNMVLDIMCVDVKLDNATYSLEVVKTILPTIKRFNLYTDINLYKKLNPLLSECYAFVLKNTFNETVTEKGLQRAVEETSKLNIDWYREFHIIIDNFDKFYYFYNEIYYKAFKENPTLSFIDFLVNYVGNNTEYLNVTKSILKPLSDSCALGYFVQYSKITDNILNSFPAGIKENIPNTIQLANVYDENGKLVEVGEMLSLFGALLDVASDQNRKEQFLSLMTLNPSTASLSQISDIFKTFDNNFLNRISESKLLNYAMTGLLNNIKLTNNVNVFLPKSVLILDDIEGKIYSRIEKKVFNDTLQKVPSLLNVVEKYFSTGFTPNTLDSVFEDVEFQTSILTNDIFEATIVNVLIDVIYNTDTIILVDSLRKPDTWLEGKGEIQSIIDSVNYLGIKVSDLINSKLDISMIQSWNLDSTAMNKVCESKFLYSNISYALNNVEQLVVPFNSKVDINETLNGQDFYMINQEHLSELVTMLNWIFINNELNLDQLLFNVEYYASNPIVLSTFTYLVGKEMVSNPSVIVPTNYVESLTKESISNDSNNPWMLNKEGKKLISAFKTLFYSFSMEKFQNMTIDEISSHVMTIDEINYNVNENDDFYGQQKGYALMASEIIKVNITDIIDKTLTDNLIESNYKALLKENSFYKVEELIKLVEALKYDLYFYTLNDINMTNVENTIFNNQYGLRNAYGRSNAFKAIVCTQLKTTLERFTEPNLFKAVSDENGFVTFEEVNLLLSAFSTLKITSFDSLNNFNFTDSNTLDSLFAAMTILESKILRCVITTELDKLFRASTFLRVTVQAKEDIGFDVMVYTSQEIVNLITSIKNIGTSNLGNIDINNINVNQLSSMLKSMIIRNSLTLFLSNNNVVIPLSSTVNGIVTIDAMNYFIETLSYIGLTNVGNMDFGNIRFDSDFYSRFNYDHIMKFTFTKFLMNNKFYYFTKDIVVEDVDFTYKNIYALNDNELYGLYLFIFYNSDNCLLSTIKYDNLNFDYISHSQLLINSVSKLLSIKTDGSFELPIIVSEEYVLIKTDLNNNLTYVLTYDEISNFLYAVKTISNGNDNTSFNLSLNSLAVMSRDNLITILKSDIIHNAISDMISQINPNLESEYKSLVNIKNNNSEYKKVITVNEILNFFRK